ncbi:MAG: hypothetical protein GX116_00055 [Fibrobacter sp.]|nr:hypothetical protein [Fibrobacter sp.]
MKHFFTLCLIVLLTQAFNACGDDESNLSASQEDVLSQEGDLKSSGDDSGNGSSSSSSSSNNSSLVLQKGSFTDKRDGHVYKTITINEQTWMAENLNYAPAASTGCFEEDDKDCSKFGRVYTWTEIIDSTKSYCGRNELCDQPLQGICPDGWRIPQENDWIRLFNTLSGEGSSDSWYTLNRHLYVKDNKYQTGDDAYGFSVNTPKEYNKNIRYFTSTQIIKNEGFRYKFIIFKGMATLNRPFYDDTTKAFLRCIKGDIEPNLNNFYTFGVRGDDRKVCHSAVIQYLREPRYICNKNGINNCKVNEDGSIKIGEQTMYLETNGKKECPFEWHIPSKAEWDSLLNYAGGSCFAGYTLKAQEGWGDDYAFDAFGLGIKPTDGNYARFPVRDSGSHATSQRIVFAKGSNIAIFEKNDENTSGLLCMKGRLLDDTLSFMDINHEYEQFTDPRDNRTYKTINLGPTKWMAENLNFKTDNSICYNNETSDFYCNRYGRYYPIEDAMTACPVGWRLPTKEDLDTLLYIASPNNRARDLVSAESPDPYKAGKNTSGFSLVLTGYQWNDRLSFSNQYVCLWSDTRYNDSLTYALTAYISSNDTTYVSKIYNKVNAKLGVRCVSETKVPYGPSSEVYGTLKDDRDGQEYKTIEINGTTWMAENLNFKTDISTCRRDSCDYYGMHYTFPFTSIIQEPLCPENWHISTTADWDSLLAYVKDTDSLTYITDLRHVFGWPSSIKGSDKYGLGILPNTCYQHYGEYESTNYSGYTVACIGAEDIENNVGYYYIMSPFNSKIAYIKNNRFRYGIRCVKNK